MIAVDAARSGMANEDLDCVCGGKAPIVDCVPAAYAGAHETVMLPASDDVAWTDYCEPVVCLIN